jgi:hypothetical protein
MSTCLACGASGHGAYDCPQHTGVPLPPAYQRPPAPPRSFLHDLAAVVLIGVGCLFGFLLFIVLGL